MATIIKSTLERHDIGLVRLALFGSRSRGTARPDSDWDFLAVIDRPLNFHQKADIVLEVQRLLAEDLIAADLVLVHAVDLERRSKDPGTIVYYALKECTTV